jgi:hypothetical protein
MTLTSQRSAPEQPVAVSDVASEKKGGPRQAKPSGRLLPKVFALIAWLLLMAAVLLWLFASTAALRGWATVALAMTAAVLVWGAALLARRQGGIEHPRENLVLEMGAVMLSPVRQFRQLLLEHEDQVASNRVSIDNMDVVLRTYSLGRLEREDVNRLARGTGRHPPRLDTNNLADDVALIVRKRYCRLLPGDLRKEPEEDQPDMLSACLHILADERAEPSGDVVPLDVHKRSGRAVDVPAETLAPLVVRHHLVAQAREVLPADTGPSADGVGDVTAALQYFKGYSVMGLVHHLRGAQHTVADNVARVVEDFKLGTLPEDDLKHLDQQLAGIPFIDLPREAAAKAARRLQDGPGLGSDDKAILLELLYRDRFGRPTTQFWSDHKKALVGLLPSVLDNSGRLVRGDLPLDADQLKVVLEGLQEFSMDLLDQVAVSLEQLWSFCVGFSAFCAAEGMEAPSPPDPDLARRLYEPFYAAVTKKLPTRQSELARLDEPLLALSLVRELGRDWVAGLRDWDDEDQANTLVELAVGAYLTRSGHRPELGHCHARGAAQLDTLLAMLAARVWQRHTVVRAGSVGQASLAQLADHWEAWLNDARAALGPGLITLREDIRSELLKGVWPTRMNDPDATGGPRVQGETPSAPALARLTGEVTLLRQEEHELAREEHELAREVHHLVVDSDVGGDRFVVTFGQVGRPLADHVERALKSVGGQSTKYTPYARLGYLPEGMTPHEFCDNFETALNASLRDMRLSRLLPLEPSATPTDGSDVTLQFIGRPTRWEVKWASPRSRARTGRWRQARRFVMRGRGARPRGRRERLESEHSSTAAE